MSGLVKRLRDMEAFFSAPELKKHYGDTFKEAADRIEEYSNAIQSYLDGNYPHPRNFRPDDCPHGVRYWMDCGSCDEEFWQTHLDRIKQ